MNDNSRPLSCSTAYHVDGPKVTRWVEVTPIMSMYGDVQCIRIVPERSLRAVSMMYVPRRQ